jgi:C1A family cysteine protease
MASSIQTIQQSIQKSNAKWVAKENPLFALSDDERQKRGGVILDEKNLQELRSQTAPEIAKLIAHAETSPFTPRETTPVSPEVVKAVADRLRLAFQAGETLTRSGTPVPPSVAAHLVIDWRNMNGVSPIEDQGLCGACVAFGCNAMLESMVLIEHNVLLDLSEAELLFCGGGSCTGWWPDSAVTYIKSKGVALASCFPYQDHNMPCTTCSKRDGEAIQAANNVVYFQVSDRRSYICSVGPMAAVFEVYDDFYAYHSGVYSHVTGNFVMLQCVEVVGFDDNNNCWICKNSWGTGFGENGFFRIAYGQCNIDGQYPFWGIYGTRWLNT